MRSSAIAPWLLTLAACVEWTALRAKLQRQVKGGLLEEEEELQRYDAILLGCRR